MQQMVTIGRLGNHWSSALTRNKGEARPQLYAPLSGKVVGAFQDQWYAKLPLDTNKGNCSYLHNA